MAFYGFQADKFLKFTPARENLDSYIAEYLQPTDQFNRTARSDTDILAGFFRSDDFNWKVSKVFKGGSLGKGTHLKGKSDIDLVIFLNGFTNHQDFQVQRDSLRARLRPCIERWNPHLLKIEGTSPGGSSRGGWQVCIRTTNSEEFMEGDILLAHDNLKRLGSPAAVYREIKQTGADFYSYSYSLNELSVEFIQRDESGRARSPKLKNLIRLVKKWNEQYLNDVYNSPPNYAFELITIYVWEKAGRPDSFKTMEMFRAIMETLVDYNNINAFWQVNYNVAEFPDVVNKGERPLILDPANPFYNVAKGTRGMYNWRETAARAGQALQSPLLSK